MNNLVIPMNPKKEYEKWERTNNITVGQLDYVKRLIDKLISQSYIYWAMSFFVDKDRLFNKCLQKQFSVTDSSAIKYRDYSKLVKSIECSVKLTKEELEIIEKLFTPEEVVNICSKKVDQLCMNDLKKLLRYNANISFNIMINDASNIPKNKNHILQATDSYEYGIQESKCCHNNEMFYIKFYDMMMLDYDTNNYSTVIKYLEPFKNDYVFAIYSTFKGYHVFIVSEVHSYNNEQSIQLALLMGCDPMYIVYCKYNGYNVRLSPKIGYDENITHEFVEFYGQGIILPEFRKLIKKFSNFNKNPSRVFTLNTNLLYSQFVKFGNIRTEHSYLKNSKFIEHLLVNNKLTYELIKMISDGFIDYINKPQRCFVSSENEYIAVDMNTNIHYICFKDILMFDIDSCESEEVFLEKISNFVVKKNDSYTVQKSTNGYHVFVTNRSFDFKSKQTIDYMIEFGCDTNYIICSYLRGFCIRLNKKTLHENPLLYEHIGNYGTSHDPEIIERINLIPVLIKKFSSQIKF